MITDIQRQQLAQLGTMQMKTLIYLHSGMVNIEIANDLERSTKTVEAYTSAIYDVLNVRNRVQAALLYERSLHV